MAAVAIQPRPEAEIAAFWRRAAARALDTALLAGVVMAVFDVASLSWALIAGAAMCWWHPVIGHWMWGRTLGKALLGIRVVDAGGRWPSMGNSALRWFVEAGPIAGMTIIAAIWFVVGIYPDGEPGAFVLLVTVALVAWYPVANVAMLLKSPQRLSIHDQAAGTWVVRERAV